MLARRTCVLLIPMTLRHHTTTFALGLIIAAAATVGIYRVLEAPKAMKAIATRPVVIALHDIAEGSAIERTTVVVARWPLGTVPAGAYQVVDSVIGRVAGSNIFKGEVIMPRRLAAVPAQPPTSNY